MPNNILINQKIKNFKKKIEVDGDKSLSIRWILFSSLASAKSTAQNLLLSEDVMAAISAIRKLGIRVIVKNKTCIIVDDIIDSGGTIVNAVDALKRSGANEVYVFITHAVLSGDAVKKIKNSKIKKLIITDTIDNSKKIKNNNKIEVLSISSLMSEAIKRIANSNSVSDLFN